MTRLASKKTDGDKIGIIGAGYQASETASYLRLLGYEIEFFADELAEGEEILTKAGIRYMNIAGIPADFQIVTAVGETELRKKLVGRLGDYSFINCITSDLGENAAFGKDLTVAPGCNFTTNVTIGSHVLVNIGCNISHDIIISDFVTISPGVNIAGKCHIGAGTFIGLGASIIDGIKVGENCIVGAGAVVVDDVPDGLTVVGVPARPLEKK